MTTTKSRMFQLIGKTGKGKNRVRENGSEWKLIEERDSVAFTSEPGPWLFLEAIGKPSSSRWIHQSNDRDFTVIELGGLR